MTAAQTSLSVKVNDSVLRALVIATVFVIRFLMEAGGLV